jgi:hypothetical protein
MMVPSRNSTPCRTTRGNVVPAGIPQATAYVGNSNATVSPAKRDLFVFDLPAVQGNHAARNREHPASFVRDLVTVPAGAGDP